MNDERRMSEVEEMLRAAGAPGEPPASFHEAARQAALGTPDVVRLRPPMRMDGRLSRLLMAAAVLTASAAAALVIGVGGNQMSVDRRISLAGAPAAPQASAVIELGSANDAVRTVVLRVSHLKPAPSGGYYEMWMQTRNGDPTGLVAFNTTSGGDVVARTTMPADMTWTRCWVTLETANGHRSTVLRGA
jgi:Anti-sigma-K factor rskA